MAYRLTRTKRSQRFTLICDPNFTEEPNLTDRYMPRHIEIGYEDQVLIGPPSTYDLRWEVNAAELTPPPLFSREICFSVLGGDLSRLATASQEGGEASDGPSSRKSETMVWLSCSQLNWTEKKKYHPLDKKWKLTICTDPYSCG